jgi:hypothetical protein
MTVAPVTPIPPERLKRMRWRGQRAYRLLSYSFSLRSNRESIVERVDDVLGGFSIAGERSSNGDVYRLVDLGPREPRRYRLLRKDQQLIGSDALVDVIHNLMWQGMLGMMEHTKDFLLFHAGAVATPTGKGVLFPAEAGSGKTTLVTGLVRAGFGFLSDEVGVIEPITARLRPFPRALNLKEGSQAVFPDLPFQNDGSLVPRSHGFMRVEKVRTNPAADPCEVRFVIAPRYVSGARTEITRLSSAETFKELWANAMNISGRESLVLPVLARIVGRTKGYRLVSGDLGEAVLTVADLAGVPRTVLRPASADGSNLSVFGDSPRSTT